MVVVRSYTKSSKGSRNEEVGAFVQPEQVRAWCDDDAVVRKLGASRVRKRATEKTPLEFRDEMRTDVELVIPHA